MRLHVHGAAGTVMRAAFQSARPQRPGRRRRHAGLPATGRELKVGDVTQLDPNIHAGVKYIRFMIDQYFKNEPMTDLDQRPETRR